MTLTPAYGRDYRSKAAVLKDWDDDKDFVVNDVFSGGMYMNRSDAVNAKMLSVNIRYDKLRKIIVVKL